ncbi:MAG: polysaccharide deacetylase family protein [Candidatus Binatia bacterium]
MRVALSIDNGPDSEVTPRVLDTLARHDVKASFFVLGSLIESPSGRDIIRRARAEGHRIGNHTYSHSVLFGTEPDQALAIQEIERTQDLLGEIGQERLFRPYGGGGNLDSTLMSRTAWDHLRNHRYSCVLWNSVPRDWEDPTGWPDRAMDDVRSNDWTVVVVHDLPTGAMSCLGTFIAKARDAGAEFVDDFPESLTPLWQGEERWSMRERGYLSDR